MSDNTVCWSELKKLCTGDLVEYDDIRKHCFTDHKETCDGEVHSVACTDPSQHKEITSYFTCGKFCDVYKTRENLGEDTVDMSYAEPADDAVETMCEKVEPPESVTLKKEKRNVSKKKTASGDDDDDDGVEAVAPKKKKKKDVIPLDTVELMEAGTSDGSASRRRPMGTTGRKVSPGGQRTRHQLPSNPRPGLPHRRYSVPETVMRKYTLTKQRELFLESPADTSTSTATAPAAPIPESSSEGENRVSVASRGEEESGITQHLSQGGVVHEELFQGEENSVVSEHLFQGGVVYEELSQGDENSVASEHFSQGGVVHEELSQGDENSVVSEHCSIGSQGGEVPGHISQGQEGSRTEEGEVRDHKDEHSHSPPQQVPPRTRRKSSPSRSKPPSRTSTVLDTVSEETGNDLATSAQERDDWTSSSATLGVPISTSATTGSSPHEDIAAAVALPQRNVTSCPAAMGLVHSKSTSPDDKGEETSTKEEATSTTSREDTPSSPSGARKKEDNDTMPNSTSIEDLSSTQTFGATSTEPRNKSKSSDQPGDVGEVRNTSSSQRDELSSTHTFGGTSTEPSSRPQSYDQPEDADQDRNTSSLEPHTTQRDEMSSTQTFSATSTEPSSRPQSHDQQGDVEEVRNTSTGIFSSPEDTVEPHTTQRDELSSSQTFGIISEETIKSSEDVRTSSTLSEESTLGRISGATTSTPEARAGSSTSPERLPPSEFEKTTSGYSGEGTTTECCVSTSPSCSLAMSTSSPDQPVTERSTSTQDQTLSVRSESVTFGRPASVIRTPKSTTPTPPPPLPAPAVMSDSEQSLGHIEFMNKEEPDFAGLFSKTLNAQNNYGDIRSSSVDDVFGSEVERPEEARNVRDIACQVEMCESTDTSVSADEGTHSKALTSLPTTEDSGHITEDVSFCGTKKLNSEPSPRPARDVEVLQKRSWEIIIQPKCYGTAVGASNTRATFRTLSNKISVLPSKVQEADFFNGPKTYLVIRPSPTPVSSGTECCPLKASIPTVMEQAVKAKPETESVDGTGPYGWSRLTEEERTVRMQHQKHRLWMNRRLASAHALPRSPDLTATEGALSSCVGPGSAYREPPLRDNQLVVPRYSALPRSVSMLVNTSSGECSSNSNSDSECLSLVDSLDESPKSKSKHDITTKLLPEGVTITGRNRILPATPRGKGKAFFVSMTGGLDKVVPVDDVKEPIVAQSMPDKLKRKLSQRQQLMEQRRRKKQGAHSNLIDDQNRQNSAEDMQQLVQEISEITQKGTAQQTMNSELQFPQVQDINHEMGENISKDTADKVKNAGKVTSPQESLDTEMKSYLQRKRSKEMDKTIQESHHVTDGSSKSSDLQHVPSQTSVEKKSQASPLEVGNGTLNHRNRRRRTKSRTENVQSSSPEVSESLDERIARETDKNIHDSQKLDAFPKLDNPDHVSNETSTETHLQASSSETVNEIYNHNNRTRRRSKTEKVESKSPELLDSLDGKRSIEKGKDIQEAQNLICTSPGLDDNRLVSSKASEENHPQVSSSEVVHLGNRQRRKSRTENIQSKSPELLDSLDRKTSIEKEKAMQETQNLKDTSPESDDIEVVPSQTSEESHSQVSLGNKRRRKSRTENNQSNSSELDNRSKVADKYVEESPNLTNSSSKADDLQHVPSHTSVKTHLQAGSSEAGSEMHNNNKREKSSTAKVENNYLQLSKIFDASQNKEQELSVECHTVSDSPVVSTRKDSKDESNTTSSVKTEATENKSPETADILRVTGQVQPAEQDVSRTKPKRKCRETIKRAKSEPPPKDNKAFEEESESVLENVTQVLTVAPKEGAAISEQHEQKENNQTLGIKETSTLMNQVQKNNEVQKPIVKSPEKSTTVGKSVPTLQTEVQEGTKTAESCATVPRRLVSRIPIDHANCQRTDYGAGTNKNRPQHRKHRVRKKSPPAAISSNNSTPSPAGDSHPARTSQIPVMKSPVNIRRSLLMDPTSVRSSQLPVLRSRFLQSPPARRSANFRFQQRFEVIPEERSASLESSAEDQATNQHKITAKPVRPVSEAPYAALHNRYRPVIKKPYQNSSSSSNQDDSRMPVRRPVLLQSRIPRPAVKEEARPAQQSQCYSGSRAALAPHVDDTDLVTLSKGWLNFYLLKDGRGTPDSVIEEASSANISDREERHSAKRTRPGRVKRTVTVVGADESRVRQYTLSHQTNEHPSPPQELSPEQAAEETKSEGTCSQGTTLPALDAGVSRRPSLEKLPLELPETEDSDHSTTYLCLPSPNRQRRVHSGLLEGSGELACSESSSVSSSDEGEKAAFPVRWPSRPMRSRVHRSRSHSNHCRRELLQSFLQSGNAPGSAGWTVTVAGSNGGLQQLPPDLEMHVTFPANVRRTAASQSDSGLGEDNNGGGAGAEDDDSKSRKDEEVKANAHDDDATQTHRWTVILKNQGAADRVPELTKSGKRPHHCLPDLSYHQNQSKNFKKSTKKMDSSLPVTSATDEDARKGSVQKRLSQLWPKVQKILESKVIIRKASGQFSQEVKSVSQLLENDIGEMMVRSGLAIKGSAITPEKKPRVPTMSERDLTRVHTAKH